MSIDICHGVAMCLITLRGQKTGADVQKKKKSRNVQRVAITCEIFSFKAKVAMNMNIEDWHRPS